LTSPDGASWIKQTPIEEYILYSAVFGNNQFVGVGDGGMIATTLDGVDWTPQNSGTSKILSSVAYGNNTFVAVGRFGVILSSTTDNSAIRQSPSNKTNNGMKITIVKNRISVLWSASLVRNPSSMDVFTVSGKRIYSAPVMANNGRIAVSAADFPTGKLLVSITDANKRVLTSAFFLTK
jgi:hypothetical protein